MLWIMTKRSRWRLIDSQANMLVEVGIGNKENAVGTVEMVAYTYILTVQ